MPRFSVFFNKQEYEKMIKKTRRRRPFILYAYIKDLVLKDIDKNN
jgi:hypothetical protein